MFSLFVAGLRLQIRHRGRRTQDNVYVRRPQLPQVDELSARLTTRLPYCVDRKVRHL